MTLFLTGVECNGDVKIAIFDQYIDKLYKIRPLLLWNANRKPYPGFRVVPFLMILSDL